jgi:hypothetical protein
LRLLAEEMSGYAYGAADAGALGSDRPLVDDWRREIVGIIPNLIRHSRTPEGGKDARAISQSLQRSS